MVGIVLVWIVWFFFFVGWVYWCGKDLVLCLFVCIGVVVLLFFVVVLGLGLVSVCFGLGSLCCCGCWFGLYVLFVFWSLLGLYCRMGWVLGWLVLEFGCFVVLWCVVFLFVGEYGVIVIRVI